MNERGIMWQNKNDAHTTTDGAAARKPKWLFPAINYGSRSDGYCDRIWRHVFRSLAMVEPCTSGDQGPNVPKSDFLWIFQFYLISLYFLSPSRIYIPFRIWKIQDLTSYSSWALSSELSFQFFFFNPGWLVLIRPHFLLKTYPPVSVE